MAWHVLLCFGACIIYLQTASIKFLLLAAVQRMQVCPASVAADAAAGADAVLPLVQWHWRTRHATAAIAADISCTAQLSAADGVG